MVGIGNTLYADQEMQVTTRYLWGAKKQNGGGTFGYAKIVINNGIGGNNTYCLDEGGTAGS